jgi:hypothetical protein
MILITQRNTDSIVIEDYDPGRNEDGSAQAYFPIERTKELIILLREITDLPITIGGFGFSLLAHEIMDYLHPDFGVVGGPDAFFARFENVLRGEHDGVANLLYWQNGQLHSNQIQYFPPLDQLEYTTSAIQEMMDFYAAFPEPGFQGAPVEITRGCNHGCRFCCEPIVAGRQVRYRDMAVIMSDIAMLVDHGINKIYMVSSELNPQGNDFILNLANKITEFNGRQTADRQVSWVGANYLLDFTYDEYQQLYRSGFTGGWFDVTALDDQNARVMRTPYRNATLLDRLKDYVQVTRIRRDEPDLGDRKITESSDLEKENISQRKAARWTMFLGNTAVTLATIRHTLRVADSEGLSQLFESCHIIRNTRIFDYEEPDSATLAVTHSINSDLQVVPYHQLLPSFAYAPALLNHFGSSDAIDQIFEYIEQTYLSAHYVETREWAQFIKSNTKPALIAGWLGDFFVEEILRPPEFLAGMDKKQMTATVHRLFFAEGNGSASRSNKDVALQLVDLLLAGSFSEFGEQFGLVNLPKSMLELNKETPYSLATAVYSRFNNEEDLLNALTKPLDQAVRGLIEFVVRAILYRFNVQVEPKYRALFVEPGN